MVIVSSSLGTVDFPPQVFKVIWLTGKYVGPWMLSRLGSWLKAEWLASSARWDYRPITCPHWLLTYKIWGGDFMISRGFLLKGTHQKYFILSRTSVSNGQFTKALKTFLTQIYKRWAVTLADKKHTCQGYILCEICSCMWPTNRSRPVDPDITTV